MTLGLHEFYKRERQDPTARNGFPVMLHDNSNRFSRIMDSFQMILNTYARKGHCGAPRDMDFYLFGDDNPPESKDDPLPIVAYSCSPGSHVVSIPSNFIMGWPYDRIPSLDNWARMWCNKYDVPFQERRDVLFWRGHGSDYRRLCVQNLSASPHVDVQPAPPYVPMWEQNRYKYILDLQGIGWSGRIAQLTWMGCVLFVAERDLHEVWFREFFEPWVHYVPLNRDCTDGPQKLQYIIDRPDKGESIAAACRRRAIEVMTEDNMNFLLARQLCLYKNMHGTLGNGV
jgi:hypothetical protein